MKSTTSFVFTSLSIQALMSAMAAFSFRPGVKVAATHKRILQQMRIAVDRFKQAAAGLQE